MSRGAWLSLGRVVFLAVTAFFAWWSLRGRGEEIGRALLDTSVAGLAGALLLVVGGLVATAFVWLRVLAAYGHRLPVAEGMAIFFVGQLGKYVPGSVWSIGVQARMARVHEVPARATVGASLMFVGFHVATAVLLGGVLALTGRVEVDAPTWLLAVAVAGAAVGLLPPVVDRLGGLVAGVPLRLGFGALAVLVALMAAAWAAYSLALWTVVPGPDLQTLGALTASFALAYAAGVVIVLAPAGLGAREGIFVVVLGPVTGVAAATGIAVLARVLHTVADFSVAGLAWAWARR